MTLGDAFNRRKKLAADLQSWIGRLGLAGTERRTYRTSTLDGDAAYRPDPGTEKVSTRQYTVQECQEKIAAILDEDEQLTLRISRTNQQARAEIEDLSGRTRVLSIPERGSLDSRSLPLYLYFSHGAEHQERRGGPARQEAGCGDRRDADRGRRDRAQGAARP